MDRETDRATAKSVFLSARRAYEQHLSPLKARLSQFLLREVNSWSKWVDLPLTERLRNYRHGFLSHSAALYDFERYDRREYLSDIQRERTGAINEREFISVVANKIGFYLAMEPFEAHRPTTFGLVDDGRFYPVSSTHRFLPDWLGRSGSSDPAQPPQPTTGTVGLDSIGEPAAEGTTTVEEQTESGRTADAATWVRDQLDGGQQLVLKPVHSAGGKGVQRWSGGDGQYRMNGEPTSPAALRRAVSGLEATVAMEFVEQAGYAQELFPDATNTVRMLTMYDEDEDEVFCPAAIHRIGTDRSAPADNFDRTGISAEIDRETGELGTGVQLSAAGVVREHDTHPATGAQITGTSVPGWETIFETVLEIATAFLYTPYIGWDVVVTDPGEFVLLEANNCPGLKSIQTHGPLLTDDRVRRFYERHNVCP